MLSTPPLHDVSAGGTNASSGDAVDNAFFGDVTLRESVKRLGAEWLVEQDRMELQIAAEITHSWFARLLVRLAMFLYSMY